MRQLHKELLADILFIAQRLAIYYNSKRSVGLTLKEGDKVYLLRKNIATKRPSHKLDYKKLGLFRIVKVKGLVNFQLVLPRTINIYPVFYISLLELVLLRALPTPIIEIQPINLNAEYEVEAILNY